MGIASLSKVARAAGALAIVAAIGAAAPALGALPSSDCQALPQNTCLGDPFDVTQPLGTLGWPGSPEEDLTAALADLQAAPDADAAAKGRGRALAIIEGSPARLVAGDEGFLDRRAYTGIPLMNTDAKVKDVPAGTTTVDVREVRFGDHALLDTSMLRFEDLDTPFTINWHVTELGTTFGTELSPVGVPASGHAQATLEPLELGSLSMGTTTVNRFHPAGDTEVTRLATQVVSVPMGPPSTLGGGILDPNLKAGHETFAQIAVGPAGATPPALPAAAQVSDWSAVGQLHADLTALDPANLDAAHTLGASDAALVGAMASRDTLPKAAAASATAAVNVQFANAEAFVDRRDLRVAPGGSVSFSITNLDGGVDRDFSVRQLHNRSKVAALGVPSWGAFDSDVLDHVVVPPGETRTLTVTPADDAFSLWVGDAAGGSRAAAAIALDRGPLKQSLELGLGPVKPLHEALDHDGKLWVSLANSDEIARLSPTSDSLSAPAPEVFKLPGGTAANPPPAGTPAVAPLLGPGDVQVDGFGVVWVTLGVANAIARIDPAQVKDGTTDGITIIHLDPCTDATCRPPPVGGGAAAPLSRIPLQLRLYEDGGENTVMFFTEQASDSIGILRVARDGTKLNEAHLNCGCLQPLGIALDPSGDIWFTEGSSNRLGRMTLDPTSPFSQDGLRIAHYLLPNPVVEPVPGQAPNTCGNPGQPACPPLTLPNPALTTLPHSVAIDRKGRVWYTGEASETIGYLDPARAEPNTTKGFTDAPGPINEFGRRLAPADIAIDADGTAFFSDEYGDQIASATIDAAGKIQAKFAFRPTARNSLTDSPLVDPAGNLWFLEAGANRITRIAGVATGIPLPARSASLVANTATGRVTGSDLSTEISSIDVRVMRGTTVVAHADGVPVQARAFSTALPLRADDRLEFVPHGLHPPAAFSFRVAKLAAGVGANGAVRGSALTGTAPLADAVTIEASGRTAKARISTADGSFSWAGPATAGGTVSWAAGTVSARFSTVTPFAAAAVAPTNPPATPGPTTPTPVPVPPKSVPQPAACATTRWLTRSGSGRKARRTLPLLGLTAADARRCLGAPAARKRSGATERWTYRGARALELRLTRGRVTAFTLKGKGLRSAPDRAQVGSSLQSFRRALGTLARDGKRGYRAAVAVGSDGAADVRLTVRSGRVTRLTATLMKRGALDASGRRLLGSAR
jgi:streptogramin lyase